MKRYLITSSLLATSLFAANNAQIIDYLKSKVPPQVKIKIVKVEKVKQAPKFELVTINLSDGTRDQEMKLFSQGDLLFPDILDTKNKTSLMEDIDKKAQAAKLKKVYTKEDKSKIIAIGHDPKKPTTIVFSDPECPYCRQELKTVRGKLKETNFKFILTPVHGPSSLDKAFLIYKHAKDAKTDEQKIALFEKYFAPDVNISGEKVTQAENESIDTFRRKYVGTIIKGVPSTFNEADVLK